MSFITVFIPDLPFYSVEEFIEDGSYRITTIKDTNFVEGFGVSIF